MPWVDQVPAIFEAWFLGGETGLALANVLTGKVNPSGKLPVTFPKKLEDNPTYKFYSGDLEAEYGEDLLVLGRRLCSSMWRRRGQQASPSGS